MTYLLKEAQEEAEKVMALLSPYCHRIAIAGCIRRRKPEVKDIELVAIPNSSKMFELVEVVRPWRKVRGEVTGKYTQRILPNGMSLDLFLPSFETWGCVFLIRTGSAEFSQALVTKVQERDLRFKDGRLWTVLNNRCEELILCDTPLETPTEESVFEACGYEWVPPEKRINGMSLKRKV